LRIKLGEPAGIWIVLPLAHLASTVLHDEPIPKRMRVALFVALRVALPVAVIGLSMTKHVLAAAIIGFPCATLSWWLYCTEAGRRFANRFAGPS
jgi:hypothetical protein